MRALEARRRLVACGDRAGSCSCGLWSLPRPLSLTSGGTMKRITATATPGNHVDTAGDTWKQAAHPWTVTLRYEGREMTFPYFTGTGIGADFSARDVLEVVASEASLGDDSFEDYCA